MTTVRFHVMSVPSFDTPSTRPAPRNFGFSERLRGDVIGMFARVTSVLIDASAALYLLGHTLVETETAARVRRLFRARPAEAPEPVPSKSFDVVDQASWESFPASDPPGY